MFSKACKYVIKAVVFTAIKSQLEKRVGMNEIAKEINFRIAFTEKVLQQLSQNKIIDSVKGPTGGYEVSAKKAAEIKLSNIVSTIDGDAIFKGCGLCFEHCNENKPSSVYHQFKSIRDELKQILETTSLLDLSKDVNNEISFLSR